MFGKFAQGCEDLASSSGYCCCLGHPLTGWGRQGPCLSQHGRVQLSPHSLPQQCQEPETRAGSVSRPRLSGSLEGLHCAWCTESRLLFCRHELEPGQKAPRSCPGDVLLLVVRRRGCRPTELLWAMIQELSLEGPSWGKRFVF